MIVKAGPTPGRWERNWPFRTAKTFRWLNMRQVRPEDRPWAGVLAEAERSAMVGRPCSPRPTPWVQSASNGAGPSSGCGPFKGLSPPAALEVIGAVAVAKDGVGPSAPQQTRCPIWADFPHDFPPGQHALTQEQQHRPGGISRGAFFAVRGGAPGTGKRLNQAPILWGYFRFRSSSRRTPPCF